MSVGHVYFSGKTYEKFARAVKRRNKEFNALPLNRQRVEIARDVIAQLKAKTIVAASVYFTSDELEYRIEKGVDVDRGDASVAFAQATDCQVCGIGSLFKCAVQSSNGLPFKNFAKAYGSTIREEEAAYLSKWFSAEMLDLVEDYYERAYDWSCDYSCRSTCRSTCRSLPNGRRSGELMDIYNHPILRQDDNNTRLTMIMQNLISNRGEFRPNHGRHSIP
jgi:hypothetical protein